MSAEEAARLRAEHEQFLRRWEDASRGLWPSTRIIGALGITLVGAAIAVMGGSQLPWSTQAAWGGFLLGTAMTHYKLQSLWDHEREWMGTVGRAIVEEHIRRASEP